MFVLLDLHQFEHMLSCACLQFHPLSGWVWEQFDQCDFAIFRCFLYFASDTRSCFSASNSTLGAGAGGCSVGEMAWSGRSCFAKTSSSQSFRNAGCFLLTVSTVSSALLLVRFPKTSESLRVLHCLLCFRGLNFFVRGSHQSYYTTVRGPDISHHLIVSGHVRSCKINKFFVNVLFFHYWQNVFAGRIWPTGRSLEAPTLFWCDTSFTPKIKLGRYISSPCFENQISLCVIYPCRFNDYGCPFETELFIGQLWWIFCLKNVFRYRRWTRKVGIKSSVASQWSRDKFRREEVCQCKSKGESLPYREISNNFIFL